MNKTDRVIIRQWKENGVSGIIAFLPDVPANFGCVMSYEHVGQHGEASLEYYWSTSPVDETSPEVVSLVAELRYIGYNPRIVKRFARPFGGWAK